MASESRRQVPILVGLLAVLAVVLWWQFGSAPVPSSAGAPTTARRPVASRAAGAGTPSPERVLAEGIGLERLGEDRPAPEAAGRDPFRSGRASAGNGPAGPGSGRPVGPAPIVPPVAPTPMLPVGPPPPPPIAVKFIGVVARRDVGKVAVLSDGKNVYYGRAGEIVDGRWRIVSIGEESLQIEYADGRGRQTVRLTG